MIARRELSRHEARSLPELARARHSAKTVLRSFFEARSYIEVDTPSVVMCPGLDAHVHSLGRVERAGQESFLITSPELHMKRLVAAGVSRIYQITHCFRSEELGAWHEPEFTMVEWYRTGATFLDLLDETEALVRALVLKLRPDGRLTRGDAPYQADVHEPFLRLTVQEAFQKFAQVDDVLRLAETDPDGYFQILVDQVEPGLARVQRPVCLTHYPLSQAGLARASRERVGFAERFELYAAGIELCNGFAELTDAVEQRRRFETETDRRKQAGEPVYPIDEEFMGALATGLPETVGNALGLDRLLALTLNASCIQDVMLFSERPAGVEGA